jgi:hypothetical protein
MVPEVRRRVVNKARVPGEAWMIGLGQFTAGREAARVVSFRGHPRATEPDDG